MNVLIDTCVWSVALRRRSKPVEPVVAELTSLITEGRARLVGPVRQELLSGIKHREQFERLRERLRAFPDIDLERADFEDAASAGNRCRGLGIQGSAVDFLLCAVSLRRKLSIFTTDGDFALFEKPLGLTLHRWAEGS